KRLREILQVPDHLLEIGADRRDLVEHRHHRGDYGEMPIETVIDMFALGRDAELEMTVAVTGRIYRVASRQLASGGYVSTYPDLTALKQRERQNEDDTRPLAVTLNNVRHGISWVDGDLVLRQLNQEFMR